MDDRTKAMLEKFARNTKGRELHEPMPIEDLITILDEQGDNWKMVWESVPTDGVFDSLYGEAGKHEAMMYENVLLVRTAFTPGVKSWAREDDVLTWLVENPPFEELVAIADLFEHSRGIEGGKSPWLLFQYIIGVAVTTQGMGLNSLMGIGKEDGAFLGRALEAWGSYDGTAEPYLELLLVEGAEEG